MKQQAPTRFPLHEIIAERWSPVGFATRPVEAEKLGSLLEAARWAPSSYNEQPWCFIVATRGTPATLERLQSCLVEGNAWARQAPVLMLSVARTRFSRNSKQNRHAGHDVGLAAASLVLQAQALGLFTHQMAGFDAEKASTLFGIPSDCEPMAMIAVGYRAEPSKIPEDLKAREAQPRTRRPLEEFVFGERWGTPYAL